MGSCRGGVVLNGLLLDLLDDQHVHRYPPAPDEAPKGLPNHYRACAPIGLEKPNEAAACEEGTGREATEPKTEYRVKATQ